MNDNNNDSLRQQLVVLNERSRWYSAELWQVPFAYLGLTGIAIAQIVTEEKAHVYFPYVCMLSVLFGIFVLIHMCRVRDLEQKAVKKLKTVEDKLGFEKEEGAESGEGWHILQFAVLFFVVIYFILALSYWCKHAA